MMRMRELRKQKKITMKQLGVLVGCSESAISQYETGKREPDFETLLKIAEYFGVSTDYLLNTEKAPANTDGSMSKRELKFALFGNPNITDDLLDEVMSFAKFAEARDAEARDKESGKTD